ncbi:DUF6870 family protein [uncultured Acetatifactor sp.]|jgi:hypothetical protein|uniref:DUF6870 family protein n=1 Tax=uncultured Acetatifactor sp. TaxID=1671927 RepID=UPI00261743A5|nr:hypothetical protein [uncultured Acetatifactor sp.]
MIDLERLRSVNPDEVNRSELVDIQDIVVKSQLPKEERIADFIQNIKNPYLCKCGNMVVQSVFEETDITLIERLIQYFRMA